jgi:hypothetical protein
MMLVCGEAQWPPKRASVLAAVIFCNYKAANTILKRNGNVFGVLVSEIKKSNHKVGNVNRSAQTQETFQQTLDQV